VFLGFSVVEALIEMHDARISDLREGISELEGKQHQRERQQLYKEIQALETDEDYLVAIRQLKEREYVREKTAEFSGLAEALKREEQERATILEAMARAREAKQMEAQRIASENAAREDAETAALYKELVQVKRNRKGDCVTRPQTGDLIAVILSGTFAEGTEYHGTDYGGKPFDSTMGADPKTGVRKQMPRFFRLGERKPIRQGRGVAPPIRGLEECLRKMSLGEEVELTVASPWAYKKGGLQDAEGEYVVPPNADLVFELKLVRVNDTEATPKQLKSPRSPPKSPKSPASSGSKSPRSPGSMSPAFHPTGGFAGAPPSPGLLPSPVASPMRLNKTPPIMKL